MIDRFYPIVDAMDWLSKLFGSGFRCVQLRIKDQPGDHVRSEIERAQRFCSAHAITLVVNDYWRLAIDCRCSWVHLGQADLVEADLPALRRAGVKFGMSTHSLEELEAALAAQPDYIALGPIYPTQSKIMPWEAQGIQRISAWKRRIGALPLVAIGGMTLERAGAAYAAGADSIAVISDVLGAPDPARRAADWVRATR